MSILKYGSPRPAVQLCTLSLLRDFVVMEKGERRGAWQK